ncbi:MAG: DUF4410 domain-containing protein [Deltaproteobacteria bacterium]|nr:MAG: DUF4410 domain-containing protein [Deltaproteobacteria bacterium]
MKNLARLGLIFLLAVNLFTFGCAAKRICTVTKPCTTKLSNYDCVKIDRFTYEQSFREAKITDAGDEVKADKLRDMLEDRVQYHIYNLSLFEDVVRTEPPANADKIVVLKGEITYMKRVTKAARVLVGAMAGRARADVDVHLVDFQTGEVIGAASIKGTSTGGGIWAGGTEEAFDNAAQIIADFMKNSY